MPALQQVMRPTRRSGAIGIHYTANDTRCDDRKLPSHQPHDGQASVHALFFRHAACCFFRISLFDTRGIMQRLKQIGIGSAMAVLVLLGSGCTLGGAVAGGVIGNQATGHSALGTVGGAVAGGIIGHELGK
jgi:osmotically inducible lipoprotein OsmB